MALLVDADRVGARRPGRPLFEDLSVTVSDGDRLGVVGINGTGKSTLLRLLAGVDTPEEGAVRRGRGARTAFLDQAAVLPAGTVAGVVGEGWEAAAIVDRLGMARLADTDTATLSGGQAKRVALARALVDPAELLILDEPTNHLDMAAIAWLEDRLAAHRGGLVLVTHDRHLLDRVTSRMLELDRGRGYVHEGGYTSYLEARAARQERAASGEAVRRNLARREAAWLRRGAPARTRKPQARIAAAEALIAERPDAPARAGALELHMGTPRLGDKVVDLEGVSASWVPDGPPVLRDVTLRLDRRERLGVVGPNGAGKSTLLAVLSGAVGPQRGTAERGPTVRVGVYDQHGADLDPDARVREVVAGPARPPGSPEDGLLMERFWFGGDLLWARVSTLSGGEMRRLQLLSVLAQRPNLLLLDEPTNDVDLDTLRALEDFLDDWPGALVAVSHDRAFLERATDHVAAVGFDGTLRAVPGGAAAWAQAGASALGAPGAPPVPVATTPAPGTTTTAPVSPVRTVGPPAGRSASTLGHKMREAEKGIARLERRRAALSEQLAAATDHSAMARAGSDLAEVNDELDGLEEAWLELASEAESRR